MPKGRTTAQSTAPSHDKILEDVVQLIQLMGQTGLAELDLETPKMKMSLKKESSPMVLQTVVSNPVAHVSHTSPRGETSVELPSGAQAAPVPKPVNEDESLHKIVSPMAGTFYRAPSPTSPNYVQEGDLVKLGQTVCIVEAMKLMNEIKADVSGRIVKILVENAQSVEKDSILFRIQTGG